MSKVALPLQFICVYSKWHIYISGKIHSLPYDHWLYRASLVTQTVKCLPTMQETQVQSLGQGRSPGEGNGNPLQYSCLENPMDGGAGRLQSTGSQRVGHDWVTSLSLSLVICCFSLSHDWWLWIHLKS